VGVGQNIPLIYATRRYVGVGIGLGFWNVGYLSSPSSTPYISRLDRRLDRRSTHAREWFGRQFHSLFHLPVLSEEEEVSTSLPPSHLVRAWVDRGSKILALGGGSVVEEPSTGNEDKWVKHNIIFTSSGDTLPLPFVLARLRESNYGIPPWLGSRAVQWLVLARKRFYLSR
jgi:hypothetical protein